jgi:EAL domain-containing protein (putative c-di-GMP-specific phosphodiesterase class I)/FixJ family two-component response regulator
MTEAVKGIGISGLRFLVAEDHGFQRWALGHALEDLGAKFVFNAGDGATALEMYKSIDPPVDIVITDLNMPGMDGMEFIRHLADFGAPVAIIVATDQDRALLASVETMVRAYGVNLLQGIQKPVTAKKLAAALAHYGKGPAVPAPAAGHGFTLDQVLAGLAADQFEPFFQPKVALATGETCGAEVVARWCHPAYGNLGPDTFIAALEASWHIDELTTAMLRKALVCCKSWRVAGHQASVSLNLSLTSLADVTLAERLMETVREAQVEARHVVFEITESAAASDLGKVLENLSRLRMNGFGLSIDHYGTGYSSLQELTRVPFTELKIDPSFVRGAASKASSRAAIESSLEMAKKLGIASVAQGVESKEEMALVRSLGCDMAQGHFIASPMKAPDFLRWALDHAKAAPA